MNTPVLTQPKPCLSPSFLTVSWEGCHLPSTSSIFTCYALFIKTLLDSFHLSLPLVFWSSHLPPSPLGNTHIITLSLSLSIDSSVYSNMFCNYLIFLFIYVSIIPAFIIFLHLSKFAVLYLIILVMWRKLVYCKDWEKMEIERKRERKKN